MLEINCREPNDCAMMGRLFLFLAVAVSIVALHPRWRSRWAWGRWGGKVALSAFGWLAWVFVFLAISASAFQLVGAMWIIAGFLLVVTAGIFDSVRYSKRRETVNKAIRNQPKH